MRSTSSENSVTVACTTAVASLGWVTPGAATEGVTPLFFLKNLATFFSRQFCGVIPVYFLLKNGRPFFSHHCHFLLISLGVIFLEGVTPHLFLPVRPRFSTILCKFAHNFFPSGVTQGGPPLPLLVTPL